MKKLTFIFALLMLTVISCEKENIQPNDAEEDGTEMMMMRGADNGAEAGTPNPDEDDDNITDPDSDEDETDTESDEDLEALNSKN